MYLFTLLGEFLVFILIFQVLAACPWIIFVGMVLAAMLLI